MRNAFYVFWNLLLESCRRYLKPKTFCFATQGSTSKTFSWHFVVPFCFSRAEQQRNLPESCWGGCILVAVTTPNSAALSLRIDLFQVRTVQTATRHRSRFLDLIVRDKHMQVETRLLIAVSFFYLVCVFSGWLCGKIFGSCLLRRKVESELQRECWGWMQMGETP